MTCFDSAGYEIDIGGQFYYTEHGDMYVCQLVEDGVANCTNLEDFDDVFTRPYTALTKELVIKCQPD